VGDAVSILRAKDGVKEGKALRRPPREGHPFHCWPGNLYPSGRASSGISIVPSSIADLR
jgi:hypothetical protein